MKYCTNCGNELRENAKFCEKCGTAKIEENKNENNIEQPINQVPQSPQNKNSNNTLIIVLSIIGVMILLGIVFVVGIVCYEVYRNIEEINDYDYEYSYNYDYDDGLEEISAGNLYLKYPSDWEIIPHPEENETIIIRGTSTISISVQPTDKTSEKEVGNEIISEMTQSGYINGENSSIHIDGKWEKYNFSGMGFNYIYIFKVEDNLLYRFSYAGVTSNFSTERYDIEDIYNTLEIRELVAK